MKKIIVITIWTTILAAIAYGMTTVAMACSGPGC